MLVLLLTVFHQALPLDLIDLNSMTGMRLSASQGPRFCPGRSPLRDVQLPKLMQQLAPTFEAALCDAMLAMMLLAHPGRRYLHGALERHLPGFRRVVYPGRPHQDPHRAPPAPDRSAQGVAGQVPSDPAEPGLTRVSACYRTFAVCR